MQQYLYGNIGHKGYVYVSSNADFFKDGRRTSAMKPILTYDKICQHGNLPMEKHKCFWMITSDLSIPGENERLFIQVSGAEVYRTGVYAYGYMSDERDGQLYDRRFLQLLKTSFPDYEEMAERYSQSGLQPVAMEALPRDQTLAPARLHPELLKNILLTILQRKRVILRLPASGAEAMRLSREYLLAIYERLPYEHRRSNGCLTGASAAKLLDWENPLPDSISIVLMDADADASELSSDDYQLFVDITVPGADSRSMPRQRGGKTLPHVKLVDFLAERTPEELDGFFRFCFSLTSEAAEHKTPNLSDYSMFADFYGGGSGVSDDRIRHWAANLNSGRLAGPVLEAMKVVVTRELVPHRLAQYFVDRAVEFDSIRLLGKASSAEMNRIVRGQYEEGSVADENCGLTFQMTEALMKYYPAGTRAYLAEQCANQYIQLAAAQPCIATEYPDRGSLAQAEQLLAAVPAANKSLAGEIFAKVSDYLTGKIDELRRVYAQMWQIDYQNGVQCIKTWLFADAASECSNIDTVYSKLTALHYSAELLEETTEDSWNNQISKWLAVWCESRQPATLAEYREMQQLILHNINTIRRFSGKLRREDMEKVNAAAEKCKQIIKLSERPCGTIPELFAVWAEIDKAQMVPAVKEELKTDKAKQVSGRLKAAEIDALVPRLTKPGRSALEQELLRGIIEQVPGLNRIDTDANLSQISQRLKTMDALKKAELYREKVDFLPWKVQLEPEELDAQLKTFANYTKQRMEPDLGGPEKRAWLAAQFRNNTDLLYLMAKQKPDSDPSLIAALAGAKQTISRDQIKELYILGWKKKTLLQKGNAAATRAWREKTTAVFEEWPSLPAAKFQNMVIKAKIPRGMIASVMLLVGLLALVPAALILLVDASAHMYLLGTAIVLCLAEFVCWIAFAVSKNRAVRSLFLQLAVALIPGLILAAGLTAAIAYNLIPESLLETIQNLLP